MRALTMSGAFVIEIEDQTAGLVLVEKGGFRFRASDPIFRKLDGRLFSHVRQARAAAAELWRAARVKAAGRAGALHDAMPVQVVWRWGS
jgi:hypothetical protein